MGRQYVCGICGKSVAAFGSWKDVEPSDLVDLMEQELHSHNVNTTDLDPAHILSRFRIVEDDEAAGARAH